MSDERRKQLLENADGGTGRRAERQARPQPHGRRRGEDRASSTSAASSPRASALTLLSTTGTLGRGRPARRPQISPASARRRDASGRRRASAATARSTAAWCASAPTTSRSRAAPWARPARSRSRACASWRCAGACRWSGSSTRPARDIQEAVWLAVRRLRAPVPRAGDMSGVVPQVARHGRPGRRRHRLHPGARRLRADGEGHRLDGARRAAARQGGDRPGHHRAGPRRLQGPHRRAASATSKCDERRRVHRSDQGIPRPSSRRTATRSRRKAPGTDPIDRREESLLDILPESAAQAVRHVQADRAIVDHGECSTSSRAGRSRSSRASRASAAAASASSPTSRSTSAASSTTTPPTRPRVSSDLRRVQRAARVPAGRARLHGRLARSSRQGIIRHGAKMLHVMPRRRCRRSRS